eukprot:TRINITY_DN57_c2_g1_i1.p2 TRINITY_DN57_c2_g1~~TRINITY_DN57_c2_g1_i1.p2  ORF type:complete len:108 (-),score=33.62 TRINITY_DN57_c2_g1_i1:273-596(-)
MTHLQDNRNGGEGQFGDRLAFEKRIKEAEDDEEDEGDDGAGFDLGEGEIAAGFFEAGLDAIDLLGFGFLGGEVVGGGGGFHGFEFLGGFVDGGAEGFVGGGAVDEDP